MLDWLKEIEMATRLEAAIARVIAESRVQSYDMSGRRGDTDSPSPKLSLITPVRRTTRKAIARRQSVLARTSANWPKNLMIFVGWNVIRLITSAGRKAGAVTRRKEPTNRRWR